MFRYIIIGIALLGGWLSYERFYAPKKSGVAPTVAVALEDRVITPPSWYGHPPGNGRASSPSSAASATAKFVCDGRQHCTQMRSCEEANFFLRNCPDTKMDGDRDGIPCEEQFCGHDGRGGN